MGSRGRLSLLSLALPTSSIVRGQQMATVIAVCGASLVVVGPVHTPIRLHLIGYDLSHGSDEFPEGAPIYWTFGTHDEAWNVARAWAEGRRENARKN